VLLASLSPRRKAFVGGLALLAVVAGSTAAALALLSRADAAPPAAYPEQDRPGPVLLVPGYGGSTRALSVLASRIRVTGRVAIVVDLPGNGTGSLTADAAALNAAVSRALGAGAPSVDVVGYSAGGVTALLWARDDGGNHKARRVITLGSPFHGTSVAAAAAGLAPGACPAACQELVPGSSLLSGLAAGAPAKLQWLSLWTTDDTTVTPPDSARLAGAIDVPLQSVCPGQHVSHSQLPTSRAVTAIVLRVIGPGQFRRPAPGAC